MGDLGADSGQGSVDSCCSQVRGWEGFEPSSILWFLPWEDSIRMPSPGPGRLSPAFPYGLSEEVSFMRPPQCIPYVPPARANKKLTWPGLDMRSRGEEPMVVPQVIESELISVKESRLLTWKACS